MAEVDSRSTQDNPRLGPGTVLRAYRQFVPFTMRQLASNSGVSAGVIQDAERGRYFPSPTNLEKLTAAFALEYGVAPEYVLTTIQTGTLPTELFLRDPNSQLTPGRILTVCRATTVLSTRDLSKATGIALGTLSNIELDKVNAHPTSLEKIIDTLGSHLNLEPRALRLCLRRGLLPKGIHFDQ